MKWPLGDPDADSPKLPRTWSFLLQMHSRNTSSFMLISCFFFDRNPALFLEMELWLYLVFTEEEEKRRFLHAAQAFVCLHNPHLGVKTGFFFYSLAYFISVNTVSRLLIFCLSGIISTS